MQITIELSKQELHALDLTPNELESIVWGMFQEYIDPEEQVNAEMTINVWE